MKRFLTLFLAVLTVFSTLLCLGSVTAFAEGHIKEKSYDGLEFSTYDEININGKKIKYGSDYYESEKLLDEVPHTFEAWVYIPYVTGAESGTIIGNHNGKSGGKFSLRITDKLNPQLYFVDKNGASHTATFTNSVVGAGKWTHIVVVFDEAKAEFRLYLNGEHTGQNIPFANTCSTSSTSKCKDGCIGIFSLESAREFPICVGGDLNTMNSKYFSGYLQDVALYSDVLTPDEIMGSYKNGVNAYDENLILYYDIDASDKGKNITDESGNGYNLFYSKTWLTEEEMEAVRKERGFAEDYAYSIAVIGDPQYATRANPETVKQMYEWVAANKNSKNIKYVIGLGDITDQCQEAEWLDAAEALKVLENAGIEYSLVRGNHDKGNGIMDSSRPTMRVELYDEIFANNEFYTSQFKENGGLYEEGSVINTYRKLTVGNDKWLIVNLDYDPSRSVREWAAGVIESHPDYRVIIVTHDYLRAQGTHSSVGAGVWNDVASRYANVELVLAGHISYDNIVVTQLKGVHGNTVTQMLIDAQNFDRDNSGSVGVVTMFYFRENGTVFDVEHYSTAREKYLKNCNQLTVDLRTEGKALVSGWDGVTATAPLGEGTKENPYKIANAENLFWMAKEHFVYDAEGAVIAPLSAKNPFKDKYFVQTADIDLNGKTLFSIGYYFESADRLSAFGGNYDGCGYTIRNAKVKNPLSNGKCVGIFGATFEANISNLTLKEIKAELCENTGFLVGVANGGNVSNCEIQGTCIVLLSNSQNNATNIGAVIGRAFGDAVVFECKNKTSEKTFNALEGASVHSKFNFNKIDENSHKAVCSCGCNMALVQLHAENEFGYCEQCEIKITGASLSIGSDVAIKYYVSVRDSKLIEGATLEMLFAMGGKSLSVTEYDTVDGEYVFSLSGISPDKIGDLIDATLIVNKAGTKTQVSSKLGYSVRENCVSLLKSDDEKLVSYINNLLNYANKAQAYTDYSTNRFAAGGVNLSVSDSLPLDSDKRQITGNKNASYKIAGFSAVYDGDIKAIFKLHIADLEKAEIKLNGETYDKSLLVSLGNGDYNLVVSDIKPYAINEEVELRINLDGSTVAKIVYGADSHAYTLESDRKQIEEDKENYREPSKTLDAEEYELFLAIYRYGLSAKEYFNSQEAAK